MEEEVSVSLQQRQKCDLLERHRFTKVPSRRHSSKGRIGLGEQGEEKDGKSGNY